MKLTGLGFLFSLASLFSGAWAADEPESVVVLTTETFDKFITDNDMVLVEFYAPWCGHCKRLAPEYEAAAKELQSRGGIPLAKVDATAEPKLADKYEVKGYPTLKLFRKGVEEAYNGGRTKDTIVSWIESMTGEAVTVIESRAAALKAAEGTSVVVIAEVASKESDAFKFFQEAADGNRVVGKFYAVIGGSENRVSVNRIGEEAIILSKFESMDDIVAFVKSERLPVFGPINGENFQDYASNGLEMVWFAAEESDFQNVAPAMREAAKDFRSKMNFVWLDIGKFKQHAENMLAVTEFPAMVVQVKRSRYVFPGKTFEALTIRQFLDDIEAGKIVKAIKSEPLPEKNDDAVRVVVGLNFEQEVIRPEQDVFLEVYAPWCGHCKKLEPIYKEFAEKMAEFKHVVIAKMDGTANEPTVDGFDYQGFPTLFFVKAGTNTPITFNGARTLEGLVEFVKEHASKPVTIEIEPKDEL